MSGEFAEIIRESKRWMIDCILQDMEEQVRPSMSGPGGCACCGCGTCREVYESIVAIIRKHGDAA